MSAQAGTIACGGVPKHYPEGACVAKALWAVRRKGSGRWHGACHFHIHQILGRLQEGSGVLEVVPAARLRGYGIITEPESVLRNIIAEAGGSWTWGRAAGALAQAGVKVDNVACRLAMDNLTDAGALVLVGRYAGAKVYRGCDDPEWNRLGRALSVFVCLVESPDHFTPSGAAATLKDLKPDEHAALTDEDVRCDLDILVREGMVKMTPGGWWEPVSRAFIAD